MKSHVVGDEVRLKPDSVHYTGPYAGTLVEIISIDNPYYYNVKGFDNKIFTCPVSYFNDDDDFFNYDTSGNYQNCTCGAVKTWGEDCPRYFHFDFCPLYRVKPDE